MLIDRRLIANFDFRILVTLLGVVCLSLTVLYSAGFDSETKNYTFGIFSESLKSPAMVKQAMYFGVGLILGFIALTLSPSFLQRWAYIAYGMGVALLIGVMLFGRSSHGATRWLSLGPITLQPSEIMKICLILALARFLSRREFPSGGLRFKQLLLPALIIGIPAVLIVEQPDLGTAIALSAAGGIMLLFLGIRPRTLATMFLALVLAIFPMWEYYLKPYQQARVLTLLNPGSDPRGVGYHVDQSKIAVGSGQVFGKGFLKGTQTQLHFLPEHTTDFVFSVLAEEWGFFGALVLISLYFLLIFLILRVTARCKDTFSALVCVGVAGMLFFQAFINIGMVIGIMPVVGITLPLVSYGGSSVLSIMIGLGLVFGVALRRFTLSSVG
jgi:rod shape determining protein RodA